MTTGPYEEPYTGQQEAVPASTRGRHGGNAGPGVGQPAASVQARPPVQAVRAALAKEGPEERYLRHIRNWVAFIGIVIAVMVALSLIGIAITVSHLSQVSSQLSGSTSSSNCLSQGGADPSC
jgi:hypothetical protein